MAWKGSQGLRGHLTLCFKSVSRRKHSMVETTCFFTYDKHEAYQLPVKVGDVFGNDTNKVLEVKT